MKKGKMPSSRKRPSGETGMTTKRRGALRDMADEAHGWDALEDWERLITR